MVLMLLGLIAKPFVLHNRISAQETPVPLPKFQMAPRLQIFQERKPDILSFCLKKSWQANPTPVSPAGLVWREMPAYRTFVHLS